MRNSAIQLIASLLLSAALLLAHTAVPARAADSAAGIALPAGEQVIDIAWETDHSVVLLVTSSGGYALRRLELSSAELSVIPVPKSFTQIKQVEGAAAPLIALSPAGNGVVVLEWPAAPLQAAELSLYRLEKDGLVSVSDRSRPADFYPAQLAWSPDGNELYLASEPYLMPEQPYSIAKLNLSNGGFTGIALKANVDMIDELVVLPQRQLLAVRCRSYRGEYPDDKVIVLVKLDSAGTEVIHSHAANLHLQSLGSGELLVYSSSQGTPGEDAAAFADAESWLLPRGQLALQPARFAAFTNTASFSISSSGEWLGFLADPQELGFDGKGGELYLGFQNMADARILATSIPSTQYRFAPGGNLVCAVDGANKVYFFELPQP